VTRRIERIFLAALLACCSVIAAGGTVPPEGAETDIIPTYELYSWPSPQSGWNFCILHTTNREKSVQEVFNEQTALHGLDALKREIFKLPKGSNIVWFDRLTWNGVKVKGSEKLKYPPKEVVDEVRHYAERRLMKLVGPRPVAVHTIGLGPEPDLRLISPQF
jgi:hypothetical protein